MSIPLECVRVRSGAAGSIILGTNEPLELRAKIDACPETRTTLRVFAVRVRSPLATTPSKTITAAIEIVRRFHTVCVHANFALNDGSLPVSIVATKQRFDAPDATDSLAAYRAAAVEDRWAESLVGAVLQTLAQLGAGAEHGDTLARMSSLAISTKAGEPLVTAHACADNECVNARSETIGFGDTYTDAVVMAIASLTKLLAIKSSVVVPAADDIEQQWTAFVQRDTSPAAPAVPEQGPAASVPPTPAAEQVVNDAYIAAPADAASNKTK